MSINNLIVLIINFKSSVQRELDRFFKTLTQSDFNIREVTKSAFTQARAKLNPWAFIRLNEVANNTFYAEAPYHKWEGMRLLSIDGTKLMLPTHQSVIDEFGQYEFGPKKDSKRCMAMASMLYDSLNLMTLDAQIAPYSCSENKLLLSHLDKVKEGDLILLDRGYPCFWLLFLLTAMGAEYCVRLKASHWLQVRDFTKSTDTERIISLKLPARDKNKLSNYPSYQDAEIKCRLVKVVLSTGEIEILCTSLLDAETYPIEKLAELYHLRWDIEEGYKMLKSRIELENFSGKTAKAVRQDFHAKILLMSLCSAYAHPIEQKVREEFKADENRKFDQTINRTNAVAMTQDILIPVLLRKVFDKALKAFDLVVYSTREVVRPGRSNPRKHKPKKGYSMNYKRL